MIYFKTCFLCYDSKRLNFSHWHGSVGQGNDYLFFSLFSDYIFLLGLEDVDGSAGTRVNSIGCGEGSSFFQWIYFLNHFSII